MVDLDDNPRGYHPKPSPARLRAQKRALAVAQEESDSMSPSGEESEADSIAVITLTERKGQLHISSEGIGAASEWADRVIELMKTVLENAPSNSDADTE